ncbi:LysR family transcriptional regulator [Pseudodonghicola flavimaris]|uniref:LysR family transcriptional regulator n=1 Tax=Pseudodonghicola flavimaris TaxID=3050036 RepID=A0ABT7F3L9_9RHOB|nr:LysR family transcriptional regulator [Pseudodonghicola flavimaris]MDK3019209.1 LysR family transcriptional regulator [Pseudodonghicola flavimaris]
MKSLSPKDPVAALTFSRLRALNAVTETGSFSAAARRMAVSQATVSQQVRDLERALGAELFRRSANDMIPTPLCQQIYDIAREIEDDGLKIAELLRRHRTMEHGELRVGLGQPLPGMALIRGFRSRFPGVEVKIEMGSWGRIVEAVAEGRVDVGVLPEPPEQERFRRRRIQSQSVVAIVHPDHPLAGRPMVSCADLAAERLIFRTAGSSTQRVVDDGFRRAGVAPRPSIVMDTRDGVLDAVSHDLGVGFMWSKGASRQAELTQLPCREMSRERPDYIFALRSTATPLSNAFFALDPEQSERPSSGF